MQLACFWAGYLTSCAGVLGLLLLLLSYGGYVLEPPSEEYSVGTEDLGRYNRAVERWEGDGGGFRRAGLDLKVGMDGRNAGGQGWTELVRMVDEGEGLPPAMGLAAYTAVYYGTRGGVLPDAVPFDVATLFAVTVREHDRRGEPSTVLVPAYFWRWSLEHHSRAQCLLDFGVWVTDMCLYVYMLDRICATVGKAAGEWGFARRYGATGYGCSPFQSGGFAVGGIPNHRLLGDWSVGIYTQLNATEVLEEEGWGPSRAPNPTESPPVPVSNASRGNGSAAAPPVRPVNPNATLHPFRLPKSRAWTGDFSNVQVRVRSVLDPLLTAEDVTNGTLAYKTRVHTPTPSLLVTVLQSLATALLVVAGTLVGVGVLSPSFRRGHLFVLASTPQRRNKLQRHSLIYS